jgi:4-amino-4-deoxy-L-arabinose transferase-like glycosyltransferase
VSAASAGYSGQAAAPTGLGWAADVPGRARLVLLALAIFLLALAPRMLARDLFPTSDEDSWMRRTGGFTFGLVNDQPGRTYQNGHPGVTTMWIGLLSLGPDGALRFADRVHGLRFVGQVPGYLDGLAQARIGFAILGAVAAAGSTLLVWRLFGAGVAVLTGIAQAAEPFLVANQQLVHVDGPLVAFTTLAVLAALVRWTADGGVGTLLLAGAATGLALLSKTPAILLLIFVPLVALGTSWPFQGPRHPRAKVARTAALAGGVAGGLRRRLFDLVAWGAVAVLTIAALWPALWVLGPGEVLARVVAFTRETGGQPDEVGSFFMGQVGADPGPLYYPVATLFRLSPYVTIGLVLAAVLIWRATPEARRRAAWLLLFVAGFGLMMTLGAKKFDRYVLPVVPTLVVLASVGWWLLVERVRQPPGRWVTGIGLLALTIAPLVLTYPYPLSYYNPLLGGGPAAQRSVMIGNGEGLDQAARWLAVQPNVTELRVAAHSWDILAGLVPADGEPLRDGIPDDADYIVTYGRRIQMRRWGPSLERYLAANPPVYTVWINGIEYVHIHPGPRRGQRP